jgi:hypothetical protein
LELEPEPHTQKIDPLRNIALNFLITVGVQQLFLGTVFKPCTLSNSLAQRYGTGYSTVPRRLLYVHLDCGLPFHFINLIRWL